MNAALAALAGAIFADPNVAQAATYTPPAGSPVECRVVVRFDGDEMFSSGMSGTILSGHRIQIDVPSIVPVTGGVFVVAGGRSYTVVGDATTDDKNGISSVRCV